MAPPGGDGLRRWLVGGLAAGGLLLAVILGAYALGARNAGAEPAGPAAVPTATAPVATAPAAPGEEPSAGDATAGAEVFAQSCTGCHLQDGAAAGGVGPKLQGLGLGAARITRQVEDGGPTMPGGLVDGEDLRDVVAYVLSIQR